MQEPNSGALAGAPTAHQSSAVTASPVRVEGVLDGHLSRWLWLVKGILLLPHLVVLVLLWLAFVALTAVALVAILVTGRYPRGIFAFNLGVLRWSWRVSFYSYNALGTDRYPPFSLAEVPDYPAQLHIEPPRQLSRGLALVKWWLLALPHYLILTLFVGGAGAGVTAASDDASWTWACGLISLLVLIAGVALLFTGRYPRSIFDFVMGMNRWLYRVVAYAALMTDSYPPFRLDAGGREPASQAAQEQTDAEVITTPKPLLS